MQDRVGASNTDGAGRPSASGAHRRSARAEWVSSRPRAERARVVADVLRERIAAGAFADGAVPDERTLALELRASRNAVREALGLLRDEGLITRRRGVGTTVLRPKYGQLDRLTGLAEMLNGYGTVTNEVRVAEVVSDPPAMITEQLELPAGSAAVHLERVRRLDGRPLSLDSTYLTPEIGRAVLNGDLVGRDVFAMIEEAAGCLLGRSEVAVHAALADVDTATLLEIAPGAAIFQIDRLTRLADGRPVDAEALWVRADRMTLHATLHRGRPIAAD
jgi:GntR family transcriptional regulator